ncbi:hypothetical protein EJB05_09140, partial [Eragrostis curvula]
MAADRQPETATTTRVGDLPEECLAYAIALTGSPRDASRCAAVSPSFRAAADSDHVWHRFIPDDLRPRPRAAATRKSTSASATPRTPRPRTAEEGAGSGAKCYALSVRRLSLPWDDGEFSWRWAPHPSSRSGSLVFFSCIQTCFF